MGATTALLYGDRDPSIAAMVLDSPFADLMQLANELAQNAREQGLRVPGFAITAAAALIRRSVRRRANFDPQDVSPIGNCDKSFIPALFAHGEKDNFIKPHHSEQLHTAYAGDKNLILFDGNHNSQRPDFFFNSAVIFLRQTLMVKEEDCLSPTSSSRSINFRGGGPDRAAARRTEEEMMRQAMMHSLASGRPAPQPEQRRRPTVPAAVLEEGFQTFEGVAGVGGTTAKYYVHGALTRGGTIETALQLYFDSGCEPAPQGWRMPVDI